jgi:plastocyanin domain-containing protein
VSKNTENLNKKKQNKTTTTTTTTTTTLLSYRSHYVDAVLSFNIDTCAEDRGGESAVDEDSEMKSAECVIRRQ